MSSRTSGSQAKAVKDSRALISCSGCAVRDTTTCLLSARERASVGRSNGATRAPPTPRVPRRSAETQQPADPTSAGCRASVSSRRKRWSCSRTRRSRAYAKFGDVAAGPGRICHSRTKARAVGPRHCQRKVPTPGRLRLATRRGMDGKAEKSRFSSSRLVGGATASPSQSDAPRRETHFCSVKPRLNLNSRVTKEVDPVAAFLGR